MKISFGKRAVFVEQIKILGVEMGIIVIAATGRASCRLCREKIKKNNIQVLFYGYRVQHNYHANCLMNRIREQENLLVKKKLIDIEVFV